MSRLHERAIKRRDMIDSKKGGNAGLHWKPGQERVQETRRRFPQLPALDEQYVDQDGHVSALR